MGPGEWVGIAVGVIAILAAIWRLIRAIWRLVRIWETGFAEVAGMHKELYPNGGNSLRDVVDQTHRIAEENNAASARLERQASRAEAAAGNAARLAAIADQRVRELAEQQAQQHAENSRRLEALEESDNAQNVFRDWALGLLRKDYDIDLLPDEE